MNRQQYIGLGLLVVFGGAAIFRYMQPEPDPFRLPGAISTSDALAARADPLGFAAGTTSGIDIPPPLTPAADPLTAGSQDARDDLYCSGVVFAAHRASGDEFSPEAQARRDRVIALAEAGVAKLIAEGVADAATTASFADAHSTQALADFAAGTPRLSVDDCEARPIP